MWLSGWMVLKVANGPGLEPSAKGRVSSKGLSLSFAFVCTLGAASAWCSSCVASIFLILTIWDNSKVMKICGAWGPVCLPHAVPVFGPELCPTGVETCYLCSISIFGCENKLTLSFHACKFNLEKESKTSQYLGVTEWRAGQDARRQPWNCPYEIRSCCPIYVTQWTPIS